MYKTTRDYILERIEEIRPYVGNFSPTWLMWQNVTLDGVPFNKLVFSELSPELLVVVFETILKKFYRG